MVVTSTNLFRLGFLHWMAYFVLVYGVNGAFLIVVRHLAVCVSFSATIH